MSTKLLAIVLLSAALFAQIPPGESGAHLSGEVRAHGEHIGGFYVELIDVQSHASAGRVPVENDGSFHFDRVASGWYAIRVLASLTGDALIEEYRQVEGMGPPLVLELPQRPGAKPITGKVSLRELQHPVPEKAVRAAVEGQKFTQAKDTPRAIAKLEKAVRIAPSYRDAHSNLGVVYARAGRIGDALAQFEQALEIGPPDVVIYSNLALAHLTLKQYQVAEDYARKAVALDSNNAVAQKLLGYASAKLAQNGARGEAIP